MLWLALAPYLSRVSYDPYWPYTNGLFKIFNANFLTYPPFLRKEPPQMLNMVIQYGFLPPRSAQL